MKKTLTAVYGLLFLVASAAVAEQYSAPDIQLSKHPVNDTDVKRENWGNNYKVRDRAEAQRQLASDDDSEYRGTAPTFEESDKKSQAESPAVKPWHFEKSFDEYK